MKQFILTLSILLILSSTAMAEDITLKTYYPSPFGAYSRIRLVPQAEITTKCRPGSLYADGDNDELKFCVDDGTGADQGDWDKISGAWSQEGDNVFPTDSTNANLKIGIGTTNPQHILHISNDSSPEILVEDSTSNIQTYLKSDNQRGYVGTSSQHSLQIQTDNTNRYTISEEGHHQIPAADTGTYTMDVEGGMLVGEDCTGAGVNGCDNYLSFYAHDSTDKYYTIGYDKTEDALVIRRGNNPNSDGDILLKLTGGGLDISGNLSVGAAAGTGDIKIKQVGDGWYATYAP